MAVLGTTLELGALFLVLSPPPRTARRGAVPIAAERVAFVLPALPSARVAEPRATSSTSSTSSARVTPVERLASKPAATMAIRRDSSSSSTPVPRVTVVPGVVSPTVGGPGTDAMAAGPLLAPRGVNPSVPLTRRVIDSVLDSLNAFMPALIWARVPSQAERDAAYKESAMATRLSGRTLLVPADPHLAPGVRLPSLPLLSSGHKRRAVARARTDSILAENMARLARLRERARRDSLRRDSLQRVDSIRRADSPGAATPRRPPDVRRPA